MVKALPRFSKFHALGNDYLVVDPGRSAFEPDPARIRALCDRHRGVGADGLLLGPLPAPEGAFGLRIFNPDGSEAEISGNGLRIFARFLKEEGYLQDLACRIRTPGRTVEAQLLAEDGGLVQVDMGLPDFRASAVPFEGLPGDQEVLLQALEIPGGRVAFSAVNLGNPHCVLFPPLVSAPVARRLGPFLERHPAFPARTNVQFAKVLDRATLRLEVWERGAGYTLASGSSASAAAAVARRLGLVDARLQVRMPGGTADIAFGEEGRILLSGEVRGVFRGRLHEGWAP